MNGTEYLLPQLKKPKLKMFYTEEEILEHIDANGIEITLMIVMSFNMLLFDYFRKFLEHVRMSKTQEGRDRYGYVSTFSTTDVTSTKDYGRMKKDIISVLFSCEMLNNLFEARGNDKPFVGGNKSLLQQLENETMSVSYYQSFYKHAYHLNNLHKKKTYVA